MSSIFPRSPAGHAEKSLPMLSPMSKFLLPNRRDQLDESAVLASGMLLNFLALNTVSKFPPCEDKVD